MQQENAPSIKQHSCLLRCELKGVCMWGCEGSDGFGVTVDVGSYHAYTIELTSGQGHNTLLFSLGKENIYQKLLFERVLENPSRPAW